MAEGETATGGVVEGAFSIRGRPPKKSDQQAVIAERLPTDPERIRSFANYFRNYMGISTIVVAALPIPATAFHSIPTYSFQTGTLAIYSSLFCFLVLAFIFFSRHTLARLLFPVDFTKALVGSAGVRMMFVTVWRSIGAIMAIGLMLLSAFCVFQYHSLLLTTVHVVYDEIWQTNLPPPDTTDLSVYVHMKLSCPLDQQMTDCILAHADPLLVGDAPALMAWYLGIFVFAEAAFVLMASKEYLQELLGLTDLDLIERKGGAFINDMPARATTTGPRQLAEP